MRFNRSTVRFIIHERLEQVYVLSLALLPVFDINWQHLCWFVGGGFFALRALRKRSESYGDENIRIRWQVWCAVILLLGTYLWLFLVGDFLLLKWPIVLCHVLAELSTLLICYCFPVPNTPPIVLKPHYNVGRLEIKGQHPLRFPTENVADLFHWDSQHLSVCVWYPTNEHSGAHASLLPDGSALAMFKVGLSELAKHVPLWLASHLELGTSNAFKNAQLALSTEKFHLIILSHGLTGIPSNYTTYAENLASQGFVVAAPTHRDGTSCFQFVAPPCRWEDDLERARTFRVNQNEVRVIDVLETIDVVKSNESFAKSVRFETFACIGHSFGGATAAQCVKQIPACVAAVLYDAWLFPVPLHVSETTTNNKTENVLFINSDLFQWGQNLKRMLEYVKSCDNSHQLVMTVHGTGHHNYNDFALYCDNFLWLLRVLTNINMTGPCDATQAFKVTMSATVEFLNNVFDHDADREHMQLKWSTLASNHGDAARFVEVDHTVELLLA